MKDSGRSILREALPLKAPYLVQIFPCYGCNFRCSFCLHTLPREKHGFISDAALMDMELYRRAIDDMVSVWGTVKMLRFAAIGEPLLHPRIAEMVAYAKEKQAADRIDIVTNGALLTPELSERLIKAGLTTLRVSIEGLSAEEYRENCRAEIDFEKLLSNLRWFYERCGGTKVYIKIIDYMLRGDAEREKRFHELFDPISHVTAVEHLTPTVDEIDYSTFSGDADFSMTQDGVRRQPVRVCPQPFYMIQLNPDGALVPCCSTRYPVVVRGQSPGEAWSGKELIGFRLDLLRGGRNDVCASCSLYQYGTYPEDVLDGYEASLIEKYSALQNGGNRI